MPGYTALSLIGLVISLSGTVIITRFLHQEWTIDSWMPDMDRTYLLSGTYDNGYNELTDNYEVFYDGKNTPTISPIKDQSEIECVTTLKLRNKLKLKVADDEQMDIKAVGVDSLFRKFYPLKAVEGTLDLRRDGQVILSEALASMLFPEGGAVGKTVTTGDNEIRTVIGVYRMPSAKTSLLFDYAEYEEGFGRLNVRVLNLVKLFPNASVETYNQRQPSQSKGMYDEDSGFSHIRFELRPFKGWYNTWNNYAVGLRTVQIPCSSQHLWMLFAVGVLLFFVGVFNFLNLYAVMRKRRTHEMQVRRIFGASKWNIFAQLYMECFVVSALAMLGVWMVIEIITPHMKDWFAIEQMTMPVFDTALSLGIMFLLPLIATASPIRVRKSNGSDTFLFLQFFISITLITISLYLMRQLHQMMTTDPGYRTENVLRCMPFPGKDEPAGGITQEWYMSLINDSQVLRNILDECPHFKSFCSNYQIDKGGYDWKVNGIKMRLVLLTPEITNMLGMEVVEGRAFDDTLDIENQYRCLLNETACKRLGVKDIHKDKVQMESRLWFEEDVPRNEQPNLPYEVVGILRDFNLGRMSEPNRLWFSSIGKI